MDFVRLFVLFVLFCKMDRGLASVAASLRQALCGRSCPALVAALAPCAGGIDFRSRFCRLPRMFIGHFGVGLGLKRHAPAVSLGTLFLAAQFLDLLWPTLLLVGVEQVEIDPGASGPPLRFSHYPISHSLVMVLAWAALFAALFYLLRRHLAGAVVCGVAVVSHWLLDLIVHHPDLPLMPASGARYGFGLWNSLWGTLLVEGAIFGIGLWLYCRTTRAVDRIGKIGFWALIWFMGTIHIANVFGSPPPNVAAVAWVGQAQWLLVLWAYWVDRHRESFQAPAPH